MRILVVDDDPLMRESIKDILESLGASVTEASNGEVAIAIAKVKPDAFNFIFCDLQMPQCDGICAMRAFADLGVTTPIALMSGAGEAALAAAVETGRQLGVNVVGSMAKPRITPNMVKTLLAKATAAT